MFCDDKDALETWGFIQDNLWFRFVINPDVTLVHTTIYMPYNPYIDAHKLCARTEIDLKVDDLAQAENHRLRWLSHHDDKFDYV